MARKRSLLLHRIQVVLNQAQRRIKRSIAIYWFGIWLAIALGGVTATPAVSQPTALDLLQQGRSLYEQEQFSQAASVLQQASTQFEATGDRLHQALTLNNLSLIYQQLGQWKAANQAVEKSLLMAQNAASTHKDWQQVRAQALETQGQLEWATGHPQNALERWVKAATDYEQLSDRRAVFRNQIHQSFALQDLGRYLEAFKVLQKPHLDPLSSSDSRLQATCLQSLSNTLRIFGQLSTIDAKGTTQELGLPDLALLCGVSWTGYSDDSDRDSLHLASRLLQYSLEMDGSNSYKTKVLLDLGNIARDVYRRSLDLYNRQPENHLQPIQTEVKAALDYYQQAASFTPKTLTQLQAAINHLSLLIELRTQFAKLDNSDQLLKILQPFTTQISPKLEQIPQWLAALERLPNTHNNLYVHLHLAEKLLDLLATNSALDGSLSSSVTFNVIETILNQTLNQAREIGDRAAESYALGYLGTLSEQLKRWQVMQAQTDQALKIAEALQVPELVYQWQWQTGRSLKQQGRMEPAIAAYEGAIQTLNQVRHDLVSLNNADLKFSFRDRVEPIYREFAELLLQPQTAPISQDHLQKARTAIQALQVAQLENFLRCTLQVQNPVELDQLATKQNAAIIYPIILPNQLAVIAKLPQSDQLFYFLKSDDSKTKDSQEVQLNQPPRGATTTQTTLANLQQFKQLLRKRKLSKQKKLLELSADVYTWLIRPLEDLPNTPLKSVKTLVFVLDDALRDIPMAALYDSTQKQFLIEKYSIVLNLGLELQNPQPLVRQNFAALIAGITETIRGQPPLPQAQEELNQIVHLLQPSHPLKELRNQQLVIREFRHQLNSYPFSLVHIATHGSFTSQLKTTGIEFADQRLTISQLRDLFQVQSQNRPEPIELLVLSACETGTGDKRASLGLAGVAVQSGARSTIASLWLVDDQSGSALMSKFYENLINSAMTSRAEALRQAQIALIRSPDLNDPAYWAAFVLVGNWL